MALKHKFVNPKADGGDATVMRPSNWNDDHTVDSGGITMDAGSTDPSAPASGKLVLYAKLVAGRAVPKIIGPSGIDAILQNFVGQDKVAWWSAPGNATTVPTVSGAAALTAATAGTSVTVATTRFATRLKRIKYSCTTTASTINSARGGVAQFTLGVPGTPNNGGFFNCLRIVLSNAATYTPGATTGGRGFFGMWATTTAPTLVEPSTLVNCIGIGYGASDSNLKLYYGGSAAQTPIDLSGFPVNTLSTDVYELMLFAPPDSNNTVHYKVTRLNTGVSVEGTLTAGTPGVQLPLNTTLLSYPVMWVGNNSALAVAQSFDFISAYISTDQ